MADKQEKDLQEFLNKVDEIESIIKGMASEDTSSTVSAMDRADKYMKDHGIHQNSSVIKTCINKLTETHPTQKNKDTVDCSPETFMKAVEKDAKERAAGIQRRKVKAEELKNMGNKCFKNQNYEEAIKLYSDALSEIKTNTAIYTNRAQAFNKVARYDKALEDCLSALKIDKACIKAYVHMGKAYLYMKEFDKATNVFQEAIKELPKQGNLLKGYLQEVESERTKLLEETKAVKSLQDDDQDALIIKSSIETLLHPGQSVNHYSDAAMKLLKTLHSSNTSKTLFRLHNGFNIYNKDHTSITRYWSGSEVCKEEEDIALFSVIIDILSESITDNDFNVQTFLSVDHSKSFITLLQDPTSQVLVTSVTFLLYLLSQTENGRKGLMNCDNIKRILESLSILINKGASNSVVAMATIANLALEQKFFEQFKDDLGKDFLEKSKTFLAHLCKVCTKGVTDITTTWSLASSGLSAMANMARDRKIRELIGKDRDWWTACHRFMVRYAQGIIVRNDSDASKTIFALLGLLTNLCSQADLVEQGKLHLLIPSLKNLLNCQNEDIIERCVSVLRFLLAYSKESLEVGLNEQIYVQLVDLLKSNRPVTVRYALKCLALCTSKDMKARQATLDNKGIDWLVYLISSCDDEIVIGNAALCLGDCVQIGEVCKQLVSTNIVQDLLKHATNENLNQDVKKNAVLCLAKLATGDTRHREKLRDLHGLEILHSVFIQQ